MRVGLLNWSGHGNLGDDAMAKILMDMIPYAQNMGELPLPANYYILGGGTLISPKSNFFNLLHVPELTIGVSLGVSSNWNGEHAGILKRFKKIYVRDFFSHEKLNEFGIPNTLSVDLLCQLTPAKKDTKRLGCMANIVLCPESPNKFHVEQVKNALSRARERYDVTYFAMSREEDMQTVPDATLFTDAKALIQELGWKQSAITTRLHATICAWLARVPEIDLIEYDPKIVHFFDRVKDLTRDEAKTIIEAHIQEICQMLK